MVFIFLVGEMEKYPFVQGTIVSEYNLPISIHQYVFDEYISTIVTSIQFKYNFNLNILSFLFFSLFETH